MLLVPGAVYVYHEHIDNPLLGWVFGLPEVQGTLNHSRVSLILTHIEAKERNQH